MNLVFVVQVKNLKIAVALYKKTKKEISNINPTIPANNKAFLDL